MFIEHILDIVFDAENIILNTTGELIFHEGTCNKYRQINKLLIQRADAHYEETKIVSCGKRVTVDCIWWCVSALLREDFPVRGILS